MGGGSMKKEDKKTFWKGALISGISGFLLFSMFLFGDLGHNSTIETFYYSTIGFPVLLGSGLVLMMTKSSEPPLIIPAFIIALIIYACLGGVIALIIKRLKKK